MDDSEKVRYGSQAFSYCYLQTNQGEQIDAYKWEVLGGRDYMLRGMDLKKRALRAIKERWFIPISSG